MLTDRILIKRYSFVDLCADGGVGLSILPLAALLTGTLLTLGIGVLLVVVLAIRRKRDPAQRSACDDKDKHLGESFINECPPILQIKFITLFIGMDMTVTAPLDMGTGQQRFVVAYTLKGVEKQPDILSAQKSEFVLYDSVEFFELIFPVNSNRL